MINFKHLHYFWAAAKSGGIVRASEQLHMTPQTLSGQIKLLEDRVGCTLFAKRGRRIELTEEGRVALDFADRIFALAGELESVLGRARQDGKTLELRVGVSDSVPKAIAYRLLEPALAMTQPVRLVCHEGKLQDLLAQLAVHRLDLVIADEPMSRELSVKAFSHALGSTAMSFFCAPSLQPALQGDFPRCLDGAPMLFQGGRSPARRGLEVWLSANGLHPRVIGEFDDAALMLAFGREGRGVFMSPTLLEAETCTQYAVQVLGRSAELVEEFFGISVERRITHPGVSAITEAARGRLFNG